MSSLEQEPFPIQTTFSRPQRLLSSPKRANPLLQKIPKSQLHFQSYIRGDNDMINHSKIKRPYIKSARLIDPRSPNTGHQNSRKFLQMIRQGTFKKHLKLLNLIETSVYLDNTLGELLYRCRNAKQISLKLDYNWKVNLPGLRPNTINSIYHCLNKLSRGIHIENIEGIEMNNQNILRFFRVLQKRPVKDFEFSQQGGFAFFVINQYESVSPFINTIAKALSRMHWLENVKVTPIHLFCARVGKSLQNSLNSFRNLQETTTYLGAKSNWSLLLGTTGRLLLNKFFTEFKNINNLSKFFIEVDSPSVSLAERIFTKATNLKSLTLNFVKYEVFTESKLPVGFEEVWGQLGYLSGLKTLEIIHSVLFQDPNNPPMLSNTPLLHLTNLKKFSLDTFNGTKRTLFNMEELGKALGKMKGMKILKIKSYITNQGLDGFLAATKDLTEIEELDLELQFDQMTISDNFVKFMQAKQQLKYLSLILATKVSGFELAPNISPKSLKNFCNGIASLKNLVGLKLCLGTLESTSHILPDAPRFLLGDPTTLFPDLVKQLKGLKKLILQIGTGYLDDSALKNILNSLRSYQNLRYLALGGNFQMISMDAFSEIIAFADDMKKNYKLKKLFMNLIGYSFKEYSEFKARLEETYGKLDKTLEQLEL